MDDNIVPAAEMTNIFPGTRAQYWAMHRHRGTGLLT